MYDDIDLGQPVDFDDLELPDPESQEDVSEEPTAVASTEEILTAVAARVEAHLSIGEVELGAADEESQEGPEPTLAHQPVLTSPPPTVAVGPPPVSGAAAPAPVAVQPAAPQPAAEGSGMMALAVAVLLAGLAIAGAAILALR